MVSGGITKDGLARELACLDDRVSAGGGGEIAGTAITRRWWAKLRESSDLLHGSRFSVKLKGAAHKSYLRQAILYGSEALCL